MRTLGLNLTEKRNLEHVTVAIAKETQESKNSFLE
jgi:hypothetical protein